MTKVKSAPQIEPYGTCFRPARECRCRTVPVNIPSIPSTTHMTTAGRPLAPPGHGACFVRIRAAQQRLHPRPRRQAGPVRTGGVLDRGRHGDGARHVVGRDRDLFRVSRRRSDPADRAPGGDAIRLRRPHRRTARQGRSHHQPPVARSGTVRPEARPDHAPPDHAGIARHRARRHSGRFSHRIDQSRRRAAPHASRCQPLPAHQNPRRSAIP